VYFNTQFKLTTFKGLTNYIQTPFSAIPSWKKKLVGTEFLSPAQAARQITNCPALPTPDSILRPHWQIFGQINNFRREFEFFIVHVRYYTLVKGLLWTFKKSFRKQSGCFLPQV
jgi:hypothetical protein